MNKENILKIYDFIYKTAVECRKDADNLNAAKITKEKLLDKYAPSLNSYQDLVGASFSLFYKLLQLPQEFITEENKAKTNNNLGTLIYRKAQEVKKNNEVNYIKLLNLAEWYFSQGMSLAACQKNLGEIQATKKKLELKPQNVTCNNRPKGFEELGLITNELEPLLDPKANLITIAAKLEIKDLVDLLIDCKESVNASDSNVDSPIIYAILQSNPGIVSALIKAGADVNITTKDGSQTLLSLAYLKRYENKGKTLDSDKIIIKELIEAGASLADPQITEQASAAARQGIENLIQVHEEFLANKMRNGVEGFYISVSKYSFLHNLFKYHPEGFIELIKQGKLGNAAHPKNNKTFLTIATEAGAYDLMMEFAAVDPQNIINSITSAFKNPNLPIEDKLKLIAKVATVFKDYPELSEIGIEVITSDIKSPNVTSQEKLDVIVKLLPFTTNKSQLVKIALDFVSSKDWQQSENEVKIFKLIEASSEVQRELIKDLIPEPIENQPVNIVSAVLHDKIDLLTDSQLKWAVKNSDIIAPPLLSLSLTCKYFYHLYDQTIGNKQEDVPVTSLPREILNEVFYSLGGPLAIKMAQSIMCHPDANQVLGQDAMSLSGNNYNI